ncbi:PREDICTED: general transcription factor II-I repeat domain-containing protein 2A-like [Diuraphis noxia]|uniref:general transcription factor II-I repeat domain-containing protein 2A-like n=1 Tax=Diuraphis noxia TaxID=143948 RepID=UPI000763B4CC|nr:PREDICTED: general transcription factor II-I repeat domain-containing protein 2A-like [Diuraphis noxia]
MEHTREFELLNLTVLEHFSEMDLVHVHSKQQINLNCLRHIRSLGKLLVAKSEILKNRSHRLYYVLPRFGMVLPLDDSISYDVFYDWLLYKSVNNLFAVIENLTTTDFKKVVTMYVSQMPTLVKEPANRVFKQTIAKPFSHRPIEPELDSFDVQPSLKESLLRQNLKFDHVLKPVSRCINKKKTRPLNHQLFRTLFEDNINESGELLLFCEVRWLTRGKALERIWNLTDEIIEFLEKNNEFPDKCELLRDKNWLINLAFLTDILGHLNILNK